MEKRRKMIAKIKIAQSQLKMDDDIYRDLLHRLTGKNSAKDLDYAELDRVLREMTRLGFKPTRMIERAPIRALNQNKLMNKINALLIDNQKSWHYANGIAKQMFQKEKVNQLHPDELRKLLIALQIYSNRRKTPLQ